MAGFVFLFRRTPSPLCAAKTNKKDGKRFTEIRNSKALRDYSIEERFEAGIKLQGTEVKAIRAGRAQINDAFGRFDKGDLWLMNAHIDEYAFGSFNNHDTRRTRKLLLHKHELRKIAQALQVWWRTVTFFFTSVLLLFFHSMAV